MLGFQWKSFFALCPMIAAAATSAPASGAEVPFEGWQRLDTTLRRAYLERTVSSGAMVSLYVQTSDVNAMVARVKAGGGSVGTISGDILTVRIPSQGLAAIAAHNSVSRLEGAQRVRPKLDKVLPAINADKVQAGTGTPNSTQYKGTGVIVGVLDYGFDVTHRAFRKADGSTRALAIWDQSGQGSPPAPWTYGVFCTAAMIDAAIAGASTGACPLASTADHGTHVTGMAAGGAVAGVPYIGIAPNADIVFVNLGTAPDQSFSTAVCDAASFIFKQADAAGKPAVINMSIGVHFDPHDGTSLANQCLDNLTGPGKILVAAAGNEGQGSAKADGRVYLHASGQASTTATLLQYGVSKAGEFINVFADAPANLTLRLGALNQAGQPVWVTGNLNVTGQPTLGPTSITVDGVVIDQIVGAAEVTQSDVRQFLFRVNSEPSTTVRWVLEVTGSGQFDAFIDTTDSAGFYLPAPSGVAINNNMSIGYPAIGAKVLAVASFVTRNEWTDRNGILQVQKDGVTGEQVKLGDLSGFSSRGPSRNPAKTGMKPDIAAPGEIIASALNKLTVVEDQTRVLKAPDDGYILMEGTSMASPAAAGAIALLLERNRALDIDGVRRIFDQSAVKVPGGSENDWGRGK
ncbi:MAG: S8 family serine peptidase, partial [Myxococcales bacterium]